MLSHFRETNQNLQAIAIQQLTVVTGSKRERIAKAVRLR
jgi:hypothetical protein